MFARLLSSTLGVFAALSGCLSHAETLDIPYSHFTLDNGLQVVVHEDRKAPIVAVNVWYHVGSKDEKLGKTGFAHLFEHLMFNGSEHHNDEYFRPFERVGATDMNGTTDSDRTNYFQNVPKNALDMALWMESDRMGHLLGAIDKAKLDEQRGVVQNEKRQRENQPYGKMMELIGSRTFPPGHPYSWQVIGSMEDLNAASLDDVHGWFKKYYGAANAVLVVAGDVDATEVKKKAQQYFGAIAPGPALSKNKQWIAPRVGTQRDIVHDKVPNARIYMVWNTPPIGDPQSTDFELLADILTGDDSSLLSKKLVRDMGIAANVQAMYYDREIAGQFWIIADALNPNDLNRIEQEVRATLQQVAKQGPSSPSLKKTQARFSAGFIRAAERIGGFGGKADILARGAVYFDNPAQYKQDLLRVEKATPERIASTTTQWLLDGLYSAHVLPQPSYKASAQDADRSKIPTPEAPPALALPQIQRETLSNGIKLVLLERRDVPLVEIAMQFKGGYSADQGKLLGGTNFMLGMLKQGTRTLSADQIAERETLLGAQISAGATLDASSIQLSALSEKLPESLALMADITRNPAFPQKELQTLKQRWLSDLDQEKADPKGVAMRVIGQTLFGRHHPYGMPLSGTGVPEDIQRVDQATLAALHTAWIRPDNAILIAAGDLNMREFKQLAQQHFGTWKAPNKPLEAKEIPAAPSPKARLYLVDQPGATQSTVIAARTWSELPLNEILATQVANDVFGGMFTSRLNMNLRESKHWSYGARSTPTEYAGPNIFYAMAMVQADKTALSLEEMSKEISAISGPMPANPDEVAKSMDSRTQKLPGHYETLGNLMDATLSAIQLGRPDDYLQQYPLLLNKLSVEDVNSAARKLFNKEEMVWLVVGDMESIEPSLRALKLGPIVKLDGDGREIP